MDGGLSGWQRSCGPSKSSGAKKKILALGQIQHSSRMSLASGISGTRTSIGSAFVEEMTLVRQLTNNSVVLRKSGATVVWDATSLYPAEAWYLIENQDWAALRFRGSEEAG